VSTLSVPVGNVRQDRFSEVKSVKASSRATRNRNAADWSMARSMPWRGREKKGNLGRHVTP